MNHTCRASDPAVFGQGPNISPDHLGDHVRLLLLARSTDSQSSLQFFQYYDFLDSDWNLTPNLKAIYQRKIITVCRVATGSKPTTPSLHWKSALLCPWVLNQNFPLFTSPELGPALSDS
eukprot:g77254.t1